ncbi:MAG: hypothetical protein JXB17_10570 [Bacteroidales bacterium]|nr:hypothetical protein [Bacteroidales bacterium]
MDDAILKFEKKIGVQAGFFEKLKDEDDWSFIIKLHALFETACTHLLIFHFNEPNLVNILSRLEISNKTTGKLLLLKEMGLLSKDYMLFIYRLSELRNFLVHDIRNSTFTIHEMVNGFNRKELKQFALTFSPFEKTILEINKRDNRLRLNIPKNFDENTLIQRVKDNPKEYIWYGARTVLIEIIEMLHYSDYKQWMKAKSFLEKDEDIL